MYGRRWYVPYISPIIVRILTWYGFPQGWKGSVKATHLVIALHDHFALKAAQYSHSVASNPNEPRPGEQAETVNHTKTSTVTIGALPETPVEDMWALEYISVNRIQPLMEALDDDGSSFVTVNEVNEFTRRRPVGWRRVLVQFQISLSF